MTEPLASLTETGDEWTISVRYTVIPAIGLMMGAYILTRMVDMLGRGDVSILAKVFSVGAILVVLFGCFVLMFGSSMPAIPPRLR